MNFLKEKTEVLSLSKYFQLVKPKYVYLKITPHKNTRNYNSTNIAKAIQHTYKAITQRIKFEQKKLFIKTVFKVSYVIDIKNGNADFYFIVPEVFLPDITEKIREIWDKVELNVVDKIEDFTDNTVFYQLNNKREDALSLQIDKKSNEPLNSILSVLEIMKDDDRVTLIYNFIPKNKNNWQEIYAKTRKKIEDLQPIEKDTASAEYIIKSALGFLNYLFTSIIELLNDFTGGRVEVNTALKEMLLTSDILETNKRLSDSTKMKKDKTVLDVQILVATNSVDKTRQESNAQSITQAFRTLDEDNELVSKKVKLKKKETINIEDYKFTEVGENTFSVDECQNFIQQPGRILMRKLGIKHIDTEETTVPKELQSGVMCMGESSYRGVQTRAYLSIDVEYKNCCLCVIAPTRAGKSTFLANISKNGIDNEETVILFDFCGNGDLTKSISPNVNRYKVRKIDCSNFNKLEGLGYNEIKPMTDNPFEVYRCAKTKTQQLVSFINSINDENKLEPRMNRYLKASALIAFINMGSFKDVFDILQDHRIRSAFIEKCPANQQENLSEYVNALSELDEYSKAAKDVEPEIVGTKIASIQGILNRVDIIKSNSYMELMLKRNCDDNIDLVKEMQKPQLICLMMPETMFQTDEERDIYCTYWLTKIIGALQIRYDNIPKEKRTKVNIIFDELYQIPNCQSLLKLHINRIAKKDAKPIISAHSLEQIKYIKPELKSANTSYMLISGCNKDNYNELKEELQPEYELEDLLSLKRYYSLNLIKCNDGFAKFITKLPPDLIKKT